MLIHLIFRCSKCRWVYSVRRRAFVPYGCPMCDTTNDHVDHYEVEDG